MSLVLIAPNRDLVTWKTQIQTQLPELEIFVYPDIPQPEKVKYAILWNHPEGILKTFPNLQWASSLGAGVEHIIGDADLPKTIPITRIVGEQLATGMARYVTKAILNNQQRSIYLLANQQQQKWKVPVFQEKTIGIMGFGKMAQKTIEVLQCLGYNIVVYSNSPKDSKGIQHFYGKDQLPAFLKKTDVLVCMLPLTPATENMLNAELFAHCKPGTYLINVARGKHVVEDDLLEAITQGQISGACLDVFREEPLPKKHPFWLHSQITVTPHCASLTTPEEAVSQWVENYHRLNKGEELLHQIDVEKGY